MKRGIITKNWFSPLRTRQSSHALWSILATIVVLSACSSGSSSSDNANNDSGLAEDSTSDTGVNSNIPLANTTVSASTGAIPPAEPEQVASEPQNPDIDSNQTSFFFSYDESASTASRDIALTALENGRKPDPALGRTYEFLNAETINAFSAEPAGPFNVSMGLLQSDNGNTQQDAELAGSTYGLGVQINGPTQTRESRRNVVLTVLLDISGSMNSSYADENGGDITSLLDVAKHGLISMQQSLKQGDIINLVTFATNANVLLEAHDPTANSMDSLIRDIVTTGSTDIENGLNLAYQVANRTYDADKANRVVIVTDANVNTGVIDPNEIARHTTINELEGIHFSGVGVGAFFNDRVLNTLTDVGKGSYSAMITPADASRIFTEGFSRFMSPAARDVRFQLTYPQEMDQLKSFAEEISTEAADVQTINFSYNSSQFFLELFSGPSMLMGDNELRLDITYEDSDGQPQSASVSKTVTEILGQGEVEIKAALTVAVLAELINGSATCDNVLSSELYNTPVQHDVYISYKQHIDNFCSL